jgi:predicted DNA-binding transcriptional regulator YafY
MAEVLAPFMHAAEVEMASQIAEDKPNVTPLKAKNAAANWLSKIIYLPERIAFIAPSVDPEIERTVHGALMEEKPLSILYRESNKRWIVSPLGIAQQGVRTYLIVQPHGDDSSPRTLLLARIRSAKEVNEAFRKPLRFNLNKFLQKSIAGPRHDYFAQDAYGEPITLKLWVHSGTQWLKETPLSEDQSVEPCDPTDLQGDYLLTCTVPLSESLVWWLLSISQYVRVLGPSNLRQRVMHDLKVSLDGYEA